MKEIEFSNRWQHWWVSNKKLLPDNFIFEHKVARGNTFNLKQWRKKQPHQMLNLVRATTSTGLCHKISDQSSEQKPCDGFVASNSHAFLCIYYPNQKHFFNIPVQKIPDTTSVSYDYCARHFTAHTLQPIKSGHKAIHFF